MLFVKGNDVVEQIAVGTANPSLCDSVLPWTPNTRANRFDVACLEKLSHVAAEFGVAIKQCISKPTWKRQRLAQLLYDPFGGGMRCDIEVQDSSPAMLDDKETIQNAECKS